MINVENHFYYNPDNGEIYALIKHSEVISCTLCLFYNTGPCNVGQFCCRPANAEELEKLQKSIKAAKGGERRQRMSYCRFSLDCDVYAFNDICGGITIMTARDETFSAKTRTEAINKLLELKNAGLDVPEEVIEEIKADLAEVGETTGIEPEEGRK